METGKEDEYLSSSDSEEEDQSSQNVHLDAIQKRRVQNENFKALLSKHAISMTTEDVKTAYKSTSTHFASTANLVAEQDFAAVITDPREYQIELFEKAKAHNTIAVLDTGSGKTLIAVLLLKHILQNELVDRGLGKPHRIAFFLVDSVTLVYQQAAVLRNNIDQNVAQLFGAMGIDLWNKQIWDDFFVKNMVIVCTAEILHQCLLNSYIKMSQINLLVFDEAHHAKKDHPYARIIKDSYLKTDPESRPRVFGMTASPIDVKGDVVKAAMTLETLLDCRICTTSNLMLLQKTVSRPTEQTWEYPMLGAPFKTELYESLHSRFCDIATLEKTFRFAWDASSELGGWCSDRVWHYVLAEEVLPRIEGSVSRAIEQSLCTRRSAKIEAETQRLREASELVMKYKILSPHSPNQMSPKVSRLCEGLTTYFERPTDTKCIVFTRQRHTARLLGDLFMHLGIRNLRPGVLIGVRSGDDAGMNTSFRQQFVTLANFRTGEINCLFATSVAEEGLDIPDCNLVVRFDLYNTLIQYIQSRGRARHAKSTYAQMIETDNLEHETRLEEVQFAEAMMRRFCECLPEDRVIRSLDSEFDSLLLSDGRKRTYTVQSTQATLTYHSALSVLARYASSLQYEKEASPQVHYVVLPSSNEYFCEVILPEKSPIRGFTGSLAAQKSLAKQSAAFDTCLLLRKNGLLDDCFLSKYQRRLPLMRNAKLAIDSKKTNEYDMISKPVIWNQNSGTVPKVLYVTVLRLTPSKTLKRDHQNLILLTREKLPNFPRFPLFLEDDVETEVSSLPIKAAMTISTEHLEALTTFTLRVFRDLFHKTYEHNPESMPYWLAPAAMDSGQIEECNDPFGLINWVTLTFVQENDELFWTVDSPKEFLIDRFVFDRWDGRYRYFTLQVEDSLHPSDPPPAFMPPRRHMDTIMSYCLSLFKNARAKFLAGCTWDQPVVRAELLSLRRNLLDRMTDQENMAERRCMICPEPLTISAIPAPVAASLFAFPAMMTRFESYLIAMEACDSLNLAIPPEYALEALTKDSDNTEDHRGEQIHFQRGMGKNYERLEFLGDAFLKMGTSISLFAQNPDDNEFDYHVNRMCLICNKNLFTTAKEIKIYEYIRSQGFSRRGWYPEGLKLLQGKRSIKKVSNEGKHSLAEKTIADVCEALIGASLISGGLGHRFDMAVRAVTIFVNDKNHLVSSWREYSTLYTKPPYQTGHPNGFEIDLAQKVQQKLGYHFKYPKLLRSAFTHSSYPSAWAKVPCYQRLEFLGDSLFDMACIEYLFHRFPTRDPQWLTEHKMAMVSNKFLGAVAIQLNLHTHLQYFSNPLQSQIALYADEVREAERESDGQKDFWVTTSDPPKCLPDMVEAYLGAIFIDSDFNFEVVEEFFRKYILIYFEDMSIYDTFANKHPTTFLHTMLSTNFGCRNYCVKAGEIPNADDAPTLVLAAVLIHDTVVARETGSSGRYAKVRASEAALEVLKGLTVIAFRESYACDCQTEKQPEMPGDEVGTAM